MNKPGTNTGHGHVWARPDGLKAKCGGPGLCVECSRDAAQQDAPTDDWLSKAHALASALGEHPVGSTARARARDALDNHLRKAHPGLHYDAPAQDAERERQQGGSDADYTRHLEIALMDCAKVAILRGDVYLCDCIDNTGRRYQSQFLADLLARAQRAAEQGANDA